MFQGAFNFSYLIARKVSGHISRDVLVGKVDAQNVWSGNYSVNKHGGTQTCKAEDVEQMSNEFDNTLVPN